MFQEVEKERERGRESGSEERASPEGITARRPMFFSGEGQTIRPLAQPLLSPSPLPARGAVRDSSALRGRRKRNPCQERAKEEQEQEEEMRREPRRRKASGGGDAFAPLRSPSAPRCSPARRLQVLCAPSERARRAVHVGRDRRNAPAR